MTTALLRALFVGTLFLAGCGGSEEADPATTEAAVADSKGAPKPKKGTTADTSRADALIADLKEREARQANIQKQHDASRPSGIPVVVEVTPNSTAKGGKGGKGGNSTYISSYTPQASSSNQSAVPEVQSGPDPNILRQEIAVAEARLLENERKLEVARQRMNTATSQMNDQNSAIRQMGQNSYRAAEQEVRSLEGAISQDRYALDAARQRLIR
jgi:hypothetical protein